MPLKRGQMKQKKGPIFLVILITAICPIYDNPTNNKEHIGNIHILLFSHNNNNNSKNNHSFPLARKSHFCQEDDKDHMTKSHDRVT